MKRSKFKIEAAIARREGETQWHAIVSYEIEGHRTTLTSTDLYDTEEEARVASEAAFAAVEAKLVARKTLGPTTTLTVHKGGKA